MKMESESEKKGRVRGLRRTPMLRLAEFFLALFGGLGVMKKIYVRAQGSDAGRRSGSAMGMAVGNRARGASWRKGWGSHLGTKMPIIFEGRGALAGIKNAHFSRIQLNENDLGGTGRTIAHACITPRGLRACIPGARHSFFEPKMNIDVAGFSG